MSTKTYFELCDERDHLQGCLDNENNAEVRHDIEVHIAEVTSLIADYDISDDDLFQCQRCDQIFDIEESVQPDGDELYCEACAKSLAETV